jgi:dienelactone hydrolase
MSKEHSMRTRIGTGLLVPALLLAACGSSDGQTDGASAAVTTTSTRDAETPFGVTTTVVSHETTRDIAVFAPEAGGAWPVVYALHGLGGSWQDWAEAAEDLASNGVVVFAADGRTTEAVEQGRWADLQQDTECGYRFVRSIAGEYGGDLEQPVTVVGHSLGATGVLEIGLDGTQYGPGGTYDTCFSGAPRPDVVVPIAGCHYEFEGNKFGFDTSGWTNQEADLVLVAGEDDAVCEAWQSQDASRALTSAGYDAALVEIAGANHFTLIFHDLVDNEWLTLPDESAGKEVVQTILDAIAAAQR